MSATAEKEAAPKRSSQMTLFEGQKITDHQLKLSGAVELYDADLIGSLSIKNDEVVLVVRGRVVGRSFKKQLDKFGNVTGTVATSVVLVESVKQTEG